MIVINDKNQGSKLFQPLEILYTVRLKWGMIP